MGAFQIIFVGMTFCNASHQPERAEGIISPAGKLAKDAASFLACNIVKIPGPFSFGRSVGIDKKDIFVFRQVLTGEFRNGFLNGKAVYAGGKAYNDRGTDIDGIRLFEDYCKKIGLDCSKIRITDASGVSKNNLISADFISEYLIKNKANKVIESLPSPGEGTLTHRMLPIKDNLKAKTGTHSDTSSIAGFLTTKNGKKYAFCIIINDTTSTISDMKTLEDYLIREAYLRL